MPDTSGQSKGKLAVSLCIPGGTSTLLLDLSSHSGQPTPDDQFNNQECPYGIVVSKAMMPTQSGPALVTVLAQHRSPIPRRNQALPPLPALGPL